jgi:uncharacterized protein (DUF924 family)
MLDQFSRNIYRNSPVPFVLADPQAKLVARYAFENDYEDKLHPVQRAWLYMVEYLDQCKCPIVTIILTYAVT